MISTLTHIYHKLAMFYLAIYYELATLYHVDPHLPYVNQVENVQRQVPNVRKCHG